MKINQIWKVFIIGGDTLFKLNTKKNIFLSAFICVLFISLIIVTSIKIRGNLVSQTTSPTTSSKEETTMKEAISIAYTKVKELSPDAKLAKIISTDARVEPSAESGANGTRAVWNVTFTDTKSNAEYNIFVSCGKAEVLEDKNKVVRKAISDSDIKIDSTDAIKIAKEQKELKPGIPNKDFAIGYHFNIYYAPLNGAASDKLIMQVIGISPNGNFAHVNIDASNGNIIDSSEKTYDENGKAIWTPF